MPVLVLLLLLAALPAPAAPQTATLPRQQGGQGQAPGDDPSPAATIDPAPPTPSSQWTDIGYLAIDAGYQNANSGFTHTFAFPKYSEQATVDTQYAKRDGATFNFSWTFRVWRNFAAGLAVAAVNAATISAPVSASIPHPLRLAAPRATTGSARIDRSETGIHLQLGYVRPVGKLLLSMNGGPSYFRLKQAFVDAVEVAESPSHETVSLLPIQPSTKKETTLGFNVALDAGYYFTSTIGVGAIARYSRGVASFAVGGGSVSAMTGGFQLAAGLRLRLPNSNTTKKPGAPPTKPVVPGPVKKPGR